MTYDAFYQVIRNHYTGNDGHVHEHYLDTTPSWHDYDLTANVAGAVPVTGAIALIYDAESGTTRDHYIGNDMHVHELYLDNTPRVA